MSRRTDPRRLAADALVRIEEGGAYANLVVPAILDRHPTMADRDRHLVTDLVYGVTRRRRTLDHLVDRFVTRDLDLPTRTALRLGAYQLAVLGTPDHAAVSTAVDVAPRRSQGLVNAVLRKVAAAPLDLADPGAWPGEGTRLSYPDWLVDRLVTDLGRDDALAALEAMDRAATAHRREDGYVQDPASALVVDAVGAQPGERVADLCAAPGGKATLLAGPGIDVVAADLRPGRTSLVRANAAATGTADRVHPVVADAGRPPFRPGSFDRVLLDAPCSGLGVLRRRPDARWRIQPDDVAELAALQVGLLRAATDLVRPGGVLVYSVCTLTEAETVGVAATLTAERPDLVAEAPGQPWRALGTGGRLLPQDRDTDGMAVFRWRRNP